jgi:molecular chaperone DnaK
MLVRAVRTADSESLNLPTTLPMMLGIDFGTTKSAAVYADASSPVIITDHQSQRSLPSVVMVVPDERLYVGREALNHAARYRQETEHYTISSIKRLVGKTLTTPLGKFETSPQEVAALILGVLRIHAENQLGHRVSNAVLAVPAHFDINQRWATLQAAELAGLKVHRLLNEASAAVLAFSHTRRIREGVVLVFDFGGGTLDVSVVSFGDNVYEVLATAGHDKLGGDDFDQMIYDWVMRRLREAFKSKVDLTPTQQLVLKEAATRAKIELSSSLTTRIFIPGFIKASGRYWDVDLTLPRATFQDISRTLVQRAKRVLKDALKKSKHAALLTHVILTGGTSRIPMIRPMVKEITGFEPHVGLDSEIGVALGASLMAASLMRGSKFLLVDVTPATYSVGLTTGLAHHLMPRNHRIPADACQTYTVSGTGQDDLVIPVYQGDHALAAKNALIGQVCFSDLPAASEVEVTFTIDANNTLSVAARHFLSNRTISARIQAPYRLTPDQLQHAQFWVDQALSSYREGLPAKTRQT